MSEYLDEMQALRALFNRRARANHDDHTAQEAFECLDTAISLFIHIQPFFHHTDLETAITRVRSHPSEPVRTVVQRRSAL